LSGPAYVNADDDYFLRSGSGTTWGPDRRIYHSGNILGTVSQAGGVPTGAIIQSGKNDFGEYTIFADGSMEQFLYSQTLSYLSSNSLNKVVPFVANFSGTSYVYASLGLSSAGSSYVGTLSSTSLGSCIYDNQTSSTINSLSISVVKTAGAPDFAPGDAAEDVQVFLKGRAF
jgi:hypothetical protein